MVTFDNAWWEPIPEGDKRTLLNQRLNPSPDQSAMTILARHGVPTMGVSPTATLGTSMDWPTGLQAFLAQEHLRRNPPQGVAGNVKRNLSNLPPEG